MMAFIVSSLKLHFFSMFLICRGHYCLNLLQGRNSDSTGTGNRATSSNVLLMGLGNKVWHMCSDPNITKAQIAEEAKAGFYIIISRYEMNHN